MKWTFLQQYKNNMYNPDPHLTLHPHIHPALWLVGVVPRYLYKQHIFHVA